MAASSDDFLFSRGVNLWPARCVLGLCLIVLARVLDFSQCSSSMSAWMGVMSGFYLASCASFLLFAVDRNACTRGLYVALLLVMVGVQCWGSGLAFSNDAWSAHLRASSAGPCSQQQQQQQGVQEQEGGLDACPNPTYVPFAVLVLLGWLVSL